MSGVRDLLKNLPARGAFASPSAGAVVRSAPTPYVAAHETAPPEGQVVTTDPTNILIRSLLMKRERDARERKARDRAKAPVNATAAAVGGVGGVGGGGAGGARPSASGANDGRKRGGGDPPAGEQPPAKREASAAAGPSGRPAARAASASQGGAGGTRTTPAAAAGATTTAAAAPTEAQLSAMTKTALVDRARRAGLAVGGTKPHLVARLVEHYRTRRGRG